MKLSEKKLSEATKLYKKGELSKAFTLCLKIHRSKPDNKRALNLLGIISYKMSHPEDAINYLSRSIELSPDNHEAHQYLAMALADKKQFVSAVTHLTRSLEIYADNAYAHYMLGNVFTNTGDSDAAIHHYLEAIRIKPDYAGAYYNLGNISYGKGSFTEALTYYSSALTAAPGLHQALVSMGLVYHAQSQHQQAIECYQRALESDRNNDHTLYLLGTSMLLVNNYSEAQRYFEAALKISPQNFHARCSLAYSFLEQHELEKAIEQFEMTLKQNPDYAEALYGIAKIASKVGQADKAISALRKALQYRPDYLDAHQSLLMHLHYSSHCSNTEKLAEHLNFSEIHEKPVIKSLPLQKYQIEPRKKLRIGYISPDFRRHSVACFIEPVLHHHNKQGFEIHLFNNNTSGDEITELFKQLADGWHDIKHLNDADVAALIRSQQIDILVDLAGHTVNNRIMVLAHKPAPLQISWIGYPGTTGMSSIDYKITDNLTDPVNEAEKLYSEKLARMPHFFLTYSPPNDISNAYKALPYDQNAYITFGSFNNSSKTNSDVINVWSKLLSLMPTAKLALKNENFTAPMVKEEVLRAFASHGIEEDRLILIKNKPSYKEHLEYYHNIDIALDTFPYNGTTTTCEALWMGVPVICLKGIDHTSRVGYSLLNTIGCPELVANDAEQYVKLAIDLASNIENLKQYHTQIPAMLEKSMLMDAEQFTEDLEQQYQLMWNDKCNSIDKAC